MDDDTLMARAQQGDQDAFGRIVRNHQSALTRFARRTLPDDSDSAYDVVQEALLRVWSSRAAYRPGGSLSSYLFRVVRNACLDNLRRVRRAAAINALPHTVPPIGAQLDADYQSLALAEAVRCAVRALPEPQRAVFVLSQYEQVPYRRIAEILDCSIGTVASRKRLAVNALRRSLAEWVEDGHGL